MLSSKEIKRKERNKKKGVVLYFPAITEKKPNRKKDKTLRRVAIDNTTTHRISPTIRPDLWKYFYTRIIKSKTRRLDGSWAKQYKYIPKKKFKQIIKNSEYLIKNGHYKKRKA